MTEIPAGWYADPSPENATGDGMRYWDGHAWTEHVSRPEVPAAPAVPAYPAYPTYPVTPVSFAPVKPSTPDGQELAGWWLRVAASILDFFISLPLLAIAATPVVLSQWDSLSSWWNANYQNGHLVANSSSLPPLMDPTSGPGLTLDVSVFLAGALYTLVFLAWKQATPGKLVVGLRIRQRARPGLPFSAILPRWGFVAILGLLSAVTAVGGIFSLVILVDYLWPLWDKNNQALHDKIAGTNVVKKGR